MGHVILERFGLLFCIGIVWAFAAILTAAGAYNNVKEQTKMNCRIDHSFLIQSAPWYVQIMDSLFAYGFTTPFLEE